MSKNLVLTGFMGVGKSSVGKIIAASLGFDFADTDEIITERENMPISKIFEEKGENYFRNLESKIIKEVSKRENTVIATGGGVPLRPDNIAFLRENGVIILLECDVKVIMKRVSKQGERPLLVSKTEEEVFMLLKKRAPFYENCDFSVDVSTLTPIEAAKAAIVAYEKRKD